MAKKTVANEIAELVAGGAVLVNDNKFTAVDGTPLKIRSMESLNDPLEPGDEITIPADYKVIAVDINGTNYPCTIAEVKAADGSERNMRLFPNSFAKNITPVDAGGRRMPKVKTSGEVATWYQTQPDVDTAMQALKGKTIVVRSATQYSIKDYTTGEIRNTRIYEYAFKA